MMTRKTVGDLLSGVLALGAVLGATVVVWRGSGVPVRAASAHERLSVMDGARLAEVGHVLGPADAPIKLVEFSDFQCPYCRALQDTLRELRARHQRTVAVVFRHYPLGHGQAIAAAHASECAAEQGRFEPYADLLFEEQDSLGILSWEALAARAGVADTARFRACRGAARTRQRVETDIAAGARIGITGTPLLVLRDRLIRGVVPLDSLEVLLRSANVGRPLR